jgi:RimJ/RimL family protein N-acetyltransferase
MYLFSARMPPSCTIQDEGLQLEREAGFFLVEVPFAVRLPDGRRVGTVAYRNLSRRRASAEIGIELYPDYRGQGVGPRAIRTLLGYLFDTLHLRRVWLRVMPDNERAIRCYEKCGFRRAGYGKAYLFVPCLVMETTADEFRRATVPPRGERSTTPSRGERFTAPSP